MKRFFSLSAAIAFAFGVFFVLAEAQNAPQQTPIHFLFPADQALAGQSTESLLKRLAEIITIKMNRPFVLDKVVIKPGEKRLDIIMAKLKKKQADFTYIPSMTYVENQAAIDAVAKPLFTVSIDNKTNSQVCFYVRKSDGINSVGQLKGKKWGGNILYHTRLALYGNGYDMPADKFFSSLTYYTESNMNAWFNALLTGKIDTFVHLPSTMRMMMNSDNGAGKIASVGCVENDYNWIFFGRNDIPDEYLNKLRTVLFKAHKDKDFKEFGFVFTMLRGHFVPFYDKDLNKTREISGLIKKGHWKDEEKAFIKKYAPPGTPVYYQ